MILPLLVRVPVALVAAVPVHLREMDRMARTALEVAGEALGQ